MKVKLFTDSDLDGLGTAIVAKLAFGDDVDVFHCSYRNLNQRVDQFLKYHQDDKETKLFITDLSVNSTIEKKLEERFNNGGHVQVIDHHVTALHFNKYPWGKVVIEYEDGRKTCATSLFYDFLIEKGQLEKTVALDQFVDLDLSERVKTLQSIKGQYSQAILFSENIRKIVNYYASPIEYETFTSDKKDLSSFENFLEEGAKYLDFKRAIENFVEIKYPSWRPYENFL